jgi:IQ domain-containing protein H
MPAELSGSKTPLIDADNQHRLTDDTKLLTGFNAANILLDTTESDNIELKHQIARNKRISKVSSGQSFSKQKLRVTKLQVHPPSTDKHQLTKRKQSTRQRLRSITEHRSSKLNHETLSSPNNSSKIDSSPKSDDDENQNDATPTLDALHERADTLKHIKSRKNDKVMNELRNYILIMNQYSLHNFIIYRGKTLRETPEFVALKEAFAYSWGSMSYIIEQLEEFIAKHNIKMAVIDGLQVYKLCQLNLPHYDRNELLSCIANAEQIKPQLAAALTDAGINQLDIIVVKIQSLIRRFLAKQRYLHLRARLISIIKIQNHYRRRRYRLMMMKLAKSNKVVLDDKYCESNERLRLWWKEVPDYADMPSIGEENPTIDIGLMDSIISTATSKEGISSMSPMTPSRKRLIIVIPSISSPEYIRLSLEDHQVTQNMHISCLYQLVDPDVHMLYVSPVKLTLADISYHEKLLEILGIPTIPKRLHFIVPELLDRLPAHISLAQTLLCSTDALTKIKFFINRIPNAMIIPTHISWADKRLGDYFNIPSLSPEPLVGVTMQSKSFIKKHFMEASVNIPVGAHDIFSEDDLIVALSRLISTNLDIRRWVLKLNYDHNNESVAYIDVEKLSVINGLRKEQAKILAESKNNLLSWYSRPVQFSVRQRIISTLRNEFPRKVVICNTHIYPKWENYLAQVQVHGLVIEEEPIEKLGYVEGLCFVDPQGEITYHDDCEMVVDDKYQTQAILMPQSCAPKKAVEGASKAIVKDLFTKFQVIGHVTVQYVVSWNGLKAIPRLSALGIRTGFTPSFSTIGNAAVISNKYTALPKSLIPAFPEGNPYKLLS